MSGNCKEDEKDGRPKKVKEVGFVLNPKVMMRAS
jgi:hypothetical protein